MPELLTMVCLANSRKNPGRCVAGFDTENRAWLRPVSSRPHREVSEEERGYVDGRDPRVLDVIRVPVLGHVPDCYQSENWVLDPDFYWELLGRADWNDLTDQESELEPLWNEPGASSTRHGQNDRVTIEYAETLPDSLRLIRVDDVRLRVFAPSADYGNPRRRVLASFTYAGDGYALWVSDPVIEGEYFARPDGAYDVGEAFLTVSLAERHTDGYCYKMVAAVIDRERAEEV